MIDGEKLHVACFRCSDCKSAIKGNHYKVENGKHLCAACHRRDLERKADKCAGCQKAVLGQYVTVNSSIYHPKCFACATCQKPIDVEYVHAEDGKYLCRLCQPRCAVCKGGLAGTQTITVDGATIHLGCFRCGDCREVIDGGHFTSDSGKHLCTSCHGVAWVAQQNRAIKQSDVRERKLKKMNCINYRLEWRPELVPCSRMTLERLGVPKSALPKSKRVCVCLEGGSGVVTCAPVPKSSPKATVNLSYLACVLSMEQTPLFSLDPKDPTDIAGEFQVKKFWPPSLAGTVFGEVLFQADYVLKELCFGDRMIDGLPNVFESLPSSGGACAARQWFVIRRATVSVAADGVIVPSVEMGVEASRLELTPSGYVDAPQTDDKEPMVLVARAITERFQEVSQQIPVVAELIELAKAVIVARYLTDRGCLPDRTTKVPAPRCPESDYAMHIPTLRKQRQTAASSIKDGQVMMHTARQVMHGGVDLGVQSVTAKAEKRRLLEPSVARSPLPLFRNAARGA